MILLEELLFVGFYLFFAILLIWKTSKFMIETKKMNLFFPFFIIGISFCFQAAFIFYNIFLDWEWVFLEGLKLAAAIVFLINLKEIAK